MLEHKTPYIITAQPGKKDFAICSATVKSSAQASLPAIQAWASSSVGRTSVVSLAMFWWHHEGCAHRSSLVQRTSIIAHLQVCTAIWIYNGRQYVPRFFWIPGPKGIRKCPTEHGKKASKSLPRLLDNHALQTPGKKH